MGTITFNNAFDMAMWINKNLHESKHEEAMLEGVLHKRINGTYLIKDPSSDVHCLYVSEEESKPIMEELERLSTVSYDRILNGSESNSPHWTYKDVRECLEQNGYKHLGWLNTGITIPNYVQPIQAFKNYSGSQVLYVDHNCKIMYSVDMGD